jgi:Tle cognate immunity protein 4 C-terminal domain
MIFTQSSPRLLVAMILIISGCKANSIAADPMAQLRECVGRAELNIPGDVDVAVNSVSTLEREFKAGSIQPKFEFEDGEEAGWSALSYMGRLYMSPPLSSADSVRLEAAAKQATSSAQDWVAKKKRDDDGNQLTFESLSVRSHRGVASRVNAGYEASLFVDSAMLWLSSSGLGTTWEAQKKRFNTLVDGISSRKPGEVPTSAAGICLPYAFIRDDGAPRRHIATTYRLKAHPDITIMLRDVTAAREDPKANPHIYDPEAKSDDFWTRYDSAYRKSLRSVWSTPYKNIKLADSVGVESFVKIVREDGFEDYGYLVVARGDPDAKLDTPDLMLYVIQNSKSAKAKGVTPLGKEAVLRIAQAIAASVKRRPANQ